MLLAIDVGNTNTTFAVFDGERIAADWRIGTVHSRTEDEYSVLLAGLMQLAGLKPQDISDVAISSVVPAVMFPLLKLTRNLFGISDPFVLNADTAGIEIVYHPKTDVGADRLANAIGAHAVYGGPAVVVDLGTATTFDAVGADGAYLGGAIAPGIEISVEALAVKAAQLRRVQYVKPKSAVATTTVESLQSGVFFGFAGQIDGIVEQFRSEIGRDARVIATGGLAELISTQSKSIEVVDPLLTLHGLRLAFERQQIKADKG
ncbi:MAG TPA: type III pantothenate kinase [Armatimonadota bacterium]|mgnify:FL=1|nr:type III pantothenate kinase [Armatimonadota bacterium]HPP75022.1 type III pantothenate kinase [Armatimonadota bacterium]